MIFITDGGYTLHRCVDTGRWTDLEFYYDDKDGWPVNDCGKRLAGDRYIKSNHLTDEDQEHVAEIAYSSLVADPNFWGEELDLSEEEVDRLTNVLKERQGA